MSGHLEQIKGSTLQTFLHHIKTKISREKGRTREYIFQTARGKNKAGGTAAPATAFRDGQLSFNLGGLAARMRSLKVVLW